MPPKYVETLYKVTTCQGFYHFIFDKLVVNEFCTRTLYFHAQVKSKSMIIVVEGEDKISEFLCYVTTKKEVT